MGSPPFVHWSVIRNYRCLSGVKGVDCELSGYISVLRSMPLVGLEKLVRQIRAARVWHSARVRGRWHAWELKGTGLRVSRSFRRLPGNIVQSSAGRQVPGAELDTDRALLQTREEKLGALGYAEGPIYCSCHSLLILVPHQRWTMSRPV